MDEIEKVIRSHLTPEMVAFDIGANWGGYGLIMASICRRVMAFEPIPDIAADLRTRAPPNLEVHTLAMSDVVGEAEFHVDLRDGLNSQQSSLLTVPELHDSKMVQTIKVKTTTLDTFVSTTGVVPHFVKIDVEGWEPAVFAGGVQTFAEHRPVILFEMWETHYPRYRESFYQLGRTHHLVKATNPLPAYGYYEQETRYEVADILCIPRPR